MQMMRVEFFLPTELAEEIAVLEEALIDAYGGTTAWLAEGAWRNGAGDVVSEEVTVILTFCEDTAENRLHIETLAQDFLTDSGEECVLYVINGNAANFVKE